MGRRNSEEYRSEILAMWFVYVLLCDGDSLYTGISPDPQKRFLEHQARKGARYTRMHKPQKIVHLEKFLTKGEALKREFEIKGWKRGEKIKNLGLSL